MSLQHGTVKCYSKDKCRCVECRQAKSVEMADYHQRNAQNKRDRVAKWRLDNPEAYRQLNRSKDPINNRAKAAQWRAENPERARQAVKAWRLANPDAVRVLGNLRQHRCRVAPGHASTAAIQGRLDYHGRRCVYCDGPYEQLDHAIPITRGGTNWPANMVPACTNCNLSKGNKTPSEFAVYRAQKVANDAL